MNTVLNDDWANSRHCKKSPSGAWLCSRCATTELLKGQVIFCDPCRKLNQEEHDANELQRRETERLKDVRCQAQRGLQGVPEWPHARVDSPDFDDKCRSKTLRQFARKYTVSNGSHAVLGPSGVGKTTACAALVHRLVNEGIEAGAAKPPLVDSGVVRNFTPPALRLARGIVWTTARDIVLARRTHELGSEPPLLDRCGRCELLIIDELGSEPNDRDGDLFSVIDHRYTATYPTIITSGLKTEDFDARYGVALLRRLVERGVKIEAHV